MPDPETIYVPIRGDRDTGEEFVHLEGASFRPEEAEAQARAKGGEWAKRNQLVRIGIFTLTEISAEPRQVATPRPASAPVSRRERGDGSRAWSRGLDEEGGRAAR